MSEQNFIEAKNIEEAEKDKDKIESQDRKIKIKYNSNIKEGLDIKRQK